MKQHQATLYLLAAISLFAGSHDSSVAALAQQRPRAKDGKLSLLIAVPLTQKNQTEAGDPGFFHLAAAQLAVEHFNARNASVVQELGVNEYMRAAAGQYYMRNCNLTFGSVQAVDTGILSHLALESIFDRMLVDGQFPDAIAGPYNNVPALEMSVVATGLQIPVVSHRAYDNNLLDPQRHPFFTQVSPSFSSEMGFVARFLQRQQRTNYIAIVYPTNSATALQKSNLLRVLLDQQGLDQVKAFPYTFSSHLPQDDQEYQQERSSLQDEPHKGTEVLAVMKKIKATGFKTIVFIPDNIFDDDTAEIGEAASRVGLDSGNCFWVISSSSETKAGKMVLNYLGNVTKVATANYLKGAAYLFSYDGYNMNHTRLDFRSFLMRHGKAFVGRVRDLNPVPDYYEQELNRSDFNLMSLSMQLQSLMVGTSFIYDAVMSIGLGACKAVKDRQGSANMTGAEHRDGIRALDFIGASGQIKFGENGQPGSRVGSTVSFKVANFVSRNESEGLVISFTDVMDPLTDDWITLDPFIYGDGTTTPPCLRVTPEQNYVSDGALGVVLVLFSIAMLTVVVGTIWVFANRNHAVVIASQPIFLYTLCFASAMVTLTILLAALDESWGLDDDALDKSCYSWMWMDALSTTLIYSALFTKLWRANRIFRYKSRNVALWRVLWPGALVLLLVATILTVFTADGNFGWTRQTIDEVSGESVGLCSSDTMYSFLLPIHGIHMVIIVLSGFLAWKTKSFDESYSESKWVFTLILVQSQAMLVGVPSIIILNETNTSARFIGMAILSFTLPISTMCLIILPKALIVAHLWRKASGPRGSTNTDATGAMEEGDPHSHRNSLSSSHRQSSLCSLHRQSLTSLPPAVAQPVGRATGIPPIGRGPRIQIVTFD